MRQCDEQRITAWFYLPENPSVRIPGILTWAPSKGGQIELIGGFSSRSPLVPNPNGDGFISYGIVNEVREGTIYAETTSGKKLSIWHAKRGNTSITGTDAITEEYWSSHWILIGEHILSPNSDTFNEVSIAIENLYYITQDYRIRPPEWAKFEGVEHPPKKHENGTLLTPYILPVLGGFRRGMASHEDNGIRYSIDTTATRPFLSAATEAYPALKLELMTHRKQGGIEVNLSVGASMSAEVCDSRLLSAKDAINKIYLGIDLMSLAMYSQCGVESIALKTPQNAAYHLLSSIGETAQPSRIHEPSRTVFTLQEIPLELFAQARSRMNSGWQAEYAWNLVVGLCGYTSNHVEEFVGQSMAAAEGFHQWCLQKGKDFSFRQRLEDLHNRLPEKIQRDLDLNVDQWASLAVWTRNHVAHGGTHRPRMTSDGIALMYIAETTHLITYLNVLTELGMTDDSISEAMRTHPRITAIKENSAAIDSISNPNKGED